MILILPTFKLSWPPSLELHMSIVHVSIMTIIKTAVLTNLVQLMVFLNQPRINSLLAHKNLPVTHLLAFLSASLLESSVPLSYKPNYPSSIPSSMRDFQRSFSLLQY